VVGLYIFCVLCINIHAMVYITKILKKKKNSCVEVCRLFRANARIEQNSPLLRLKKLCEDHARGGIYVHAPS
jgi:hypothetical protein